MKRIRSIKSFYVTLATGMVMLISAVQFPFSFLEIPIIARAAEDTAELLSTEFSVGTVLDNAYENDYFGYRINLPEGYVFLTVEEIAERNGETADFYNDLDAIRERVVSGSSVMRAYAKDQNATSDSIKIYLNGLAVGSVTEKQLVDATVKSMPSIFEENGIILDNIEAVQEEFGGETHYVINIAGEYSGRKIAERMIYLVRDNYYLSITIMNYDKDNTGALIAGIEKISADSSFLPDDGDNLPGEINEVTVNDAKSVDDYPEFWNNFNGAAVENNPQYYTYFTVPEGKTLHLDAISLYHYNYGHGAEPGTIYLINENKEIIGTWKASGNRYLNYYWDVFPDIDLEAGLYVIDCDGNSTWSCNLGSDYKGFAQVFASYK